MHTRPSNYAREIGQILAWVPHKIYGFFSLFASVIFSLPLALNILNMIHVNTTWISLIFFYLWFSDILIIFENYSSLYLQIFLLTYSLSLFLLEFQFTPILHHLTLSCRSWIFCLFIPYSFFSLLFGLGDFYRFIFKCTDSFLDCV